MHHIPTIVVSSLLGIASMATAQVTLQMEFAQPLSVVLGASSASWPAGPVTGNGSIQAALPSPPLPALTASIFWSAPTASQLGGSVRFARGQNNWPIAFPQFLAEVLLTVDGPAGQWVTLDTFTSLPQPFGTSQPVVLSIDIGDDGTSERLNSPPPTPSNSTNFTEYWRVPFQLTSTPTPIRILAQCELVLETGMPIYFDVLPWHPSASDRGSSCASNNTGWFHSPPRVFDYSLLVESGAGADLIARAEGIGSYQAFVVSMQPNRVPVGTIGLGNGCDDLLQNVVATAAGNHQGWLSPEYSIAIPALPPGMTLFLQHVSMGDDPGNPTLYFGASNVVRIDT